MEYTYTREGMEDRFFFVTVAQKSANGLQSVVLGLVALSVHALSSAHLQHAVL